MEAYLETEVVAAGTQYRDQIKDIFCCSRYTMIYNDILKLISTDIYRHC